MNSETDGGRRGARQEKVRRTDRERMREVEREREIEEEGGRQRERANKDRMR